MLNQLRLSTQILFAKGDIEAKANILYLAPHPTQSHLAIVITDVTPFHPRDYNWPDHPADKGNLIIDEETIEITDCIIVARNLETGELFVDQDIPIKRGALNWIFLVGHVFSAQHANTLSIENSVTLQVDYFYRQQLSFSHSLDHIATLALNAATNDYWKKEVSKDSLGHFSLDNLALKESRISCDGSQDVYRLGKSIKKKGFNREEFYQNIKIIEQNINNIFQSWLEEDCHITMIPEVSRLDDPRIWHATIAGQKAAISCGGSHVKNFSIKDKMIKINLIPDQQAEQCLMKINWRNA